jgi:hypothetical protein
VVTQIVYLYDGGYQIFANGDNHYSILTTSETTTINNLSLVIDSLATKEVTLNGSKDGVTDNGNSSYNFTLAGTGPNVITVSVLAEDGIATAAYTIEVFRDNSPNIVLSSITVTESGVSNTMTGVYSAALNSYIFSSPVSIAKETDSVTLTPNYGTGSTKVYATAATNSLETVTKNSNGDFVINSLNFGWNNVHLNVYEPDGRYSRSHKLNLWKAGSFEVSALSGSDVLGLLDFDVSLNNEFYVVVPFGVDDVRLKPLLNASNASVISDSGSDVTLTEFLDNKYSDTIHLGNNSITIMLLIKQPNAQSLVYTIHLVRPVAA